MALTIEYPEHLSCPRAHPKRKSRAMSLNQCVKRLPVASSISISSCFETFLWSRISFGFGLTVASEQTKRIKSTKGKPQVRLHYMRTSKPRRDPLAFMFAPQPIARSKVMHLCKMPHLVSRCLMLQNSHLMFELAMSGDFHAVLPLLDLLFFETVKRARAEGICPHVWEGNLLSCPSLGRRRRFDRGDLFQYSLSRTGSC